MLMILALHSFNTYFWNSMSGSISLQGIVAILGEAFTSCSVGLFVFISGWYGIKPKVRSLVNIVFQVVFYGFVIFLIVSLVSGSICWEGLKEIVLLSSSLWFIKSYLLLYIISPVLNVFVENSDKKQFKTVLIAFFVFQSIWGWTNTAKEFNFGLSVVYFIFMYLLARYMRLNCKGITNRSKYLYLGVYLLSGLFIAGMLFIKHYFGIIPLTEHMIISYICPLMVLCSVSLFLFFSRLHFKSKVVNWISASCLSVYLIHANSLVATHYHNIVWKEYLGEQYLLFIGTIIGVFVFCISVDQIRRLIYKVTICKMLIKK